MVGRFMFAKIRRAALKKSRGGFLPKAKAVC